MAPDQIIQSSGPLDSAAYAAGHGALVVRTFDGPTDRVVAGARVRLWGTGASVVAPTDEETGDTDGVHTFVRIPTGAYVLRIATIGSHIQTIGHDIRAGLIDTLSIGLRRGALCLAH